MPKITATLETATALTPVEKGWYAAHVVYQNLDSSRKTGAPMIGLQFEIDEGPYRGRRLPGSHEKALHRVMVGGTKEDGTPHDLGRLMGLINALDANWTCMNCNHTSNDKFSRRNSKYFCPNCGQQARIEFDTDSWMGARCRIQVDTKLVEGFDEPVNEIKSLRPMGSAVPTAQAS